MKRKIYCTNVHLRIIEILITSVYNSVLSLLPLQGRRWSPSRGMPFLAVGRGACRGALFLRALVPAPAPSWFLGGFLPPCGVSSGVLSL